MPTSKPTNVDAQRILAIMDELKEKLTYLSVISSQVLEGVQAEEGQATAELLGAELMKQFQEQIRLEELYLVANTASDGTFTQADDTDEQREDAKLLQKNTLELCRKMKSIPTIVTVLSPFQETRPGAAIQFVKTLVDMQELILKRLTSTVEEERSRQELLEHYRSHEEELTKRRQQLDKDLAHIHRERERAQTQRTEQLTKLKADLQDVKDSTEARMEQLRKHYESRMRDHQEAFNEREKKYKEQIEKLQGTNTKLRGESLEDEQVLLKKKSRFETDVAHVISDYDKEIREMAYNVTEHLDGESKETKQLMELKEHFSKIDSERYAIDAEEAITKARRNKMEAEKKKRTESAALVQAFYRGIVQRDQFMEMKKKLRKGGKGKAKAKK